LYIVKYYTYLLGGNYMEFTKEENLKIQFNKFWSSIFGKTEDYFSLMTRNDFNMLKIVLSNINNIITYNATIALAEKISDIFSFSDLEKERILSLTKNTSPSSNGYDIIYLGDIKIISEVKCNIPHLINRFGGGQKEGINKDLLSLFNGKSKLNLKWEDLRDYYKFLGIYQFDSNTRDAVIYHINHLPEDLIEYVELVSEKTVYNKDKAYILLL